MLTNNFWAKIVLAVVSISFLIPATSATVRAFPFFILCLSCMFRRGYWKETRKGIVTFLIGGSILTLGFHGMLETKDLALFFICFCGISYMSEQFIFKPKYLYVFFVCSVLPSSFYHMIIDGNVTWIPSNGVINIFGGVSTKHGTAIAGVLLLLPSLCYLFERHKGLIVEYSTKKLLLLLTLSLYLVVFSSSRSVTLAVGALGIYLYVNRKHFKKKLSILLFVIFNLSVFLMEYISDYITYINEIPWLAEFVHTDDFEQYGVTSGRAWLWGVHMHSFITSPFLMGGGRAETDFFVGDWLPWLGVQAQAGSESVYTGYLACYGLVGVGLILIQLRLFLIAVKKEAVLASAIMFFMIYNTTMGMSLVTSYDYVGILCYFLYFMYLNKSVSYKQYGVKI